MVFVNDTNHSYLNSRNQELINEIQISHFRSLDTENRRIIEDIHACRECTVPTYYNLENVY